MKIQVQAPGKLILLGEYAVLEGADALVMSVNRFARVTIEEIRPAGQFILSGNLFAEPLIFTIDDRGALGPFDKAQSAIASRLSFSTTAIERTCRQIAKMIPINRAFKIDLDTRAFHDADKNMKLGLGSSAALTVAVIDGLVRFFGMVKALIPTRNDLFRLAQDIHEEVQGKQGSGIDIAASAIGGILKYNMAAYTGSDATGMTAFPDHLAQLKVLTVWSGESASTATFLSRLAIFKSNHKSQYTKLIRHMTALSEEGCRTYLSGNFPAFMEVVDAYGRTMESLGQQADIPVFSGSHQTIAAFIRKAGGVYKPSGAGGGDLGVAFFKTDTDRTRAREVLEINGFWCPELKTAAS